MTKFLCLIFTLNWIALFWLVVLGKVQVDVYTLLFGLVLLIGSLTTSPTPTQPTIIVQGGSDDRTLE